MTCLKIVILSGFGREFIPIARIHVKAWDLVE
jgi:hypothetical protein